MSVTRQLKFRLERALSRLCPSCHYWAVSLYHPIKAWLFLRKYPKVVTGRPHIVLVTGEDGPDKMTGYSAGYEVYRVLRHHYNVDLLVHASFKEKNAVAIAQQKPDLVMLTFDSGEFQQVFEKLGVPLMGSDSRVSRTCYDKIAAKEFLRKQGIVTAPWVVLQGAESAKQLGDEFRFPLVIKPRRSGTSAGVSKVESPVELRKAVRRAQKWDAEVIAEPYIKGREFTCTVCGNRTPQTLPLNRKIMRFERAEMEARGEKLLKYRFPVTPEEPFVTEILELSKRIYTLFGCRDMVRIDWIYDDAAGLPYFVEINTLPWMGRAGGNIEDCAEAAGSSYEEFVLDLFRDALNRVQGGEARKTEMN